MRWESSVAVGKLRGNKTPPDRFSRFEYKRLLDQFRRPR